MFKIIILYLTSFFSICSFAQSGAKISASASVTMEGGMTKEYTISKAIEKAKAKALANKFSQNVGRDQSSSLRNGKNYITDNFYVGCRGEWIADTKKPNVEVEIVDGDVVYTATVYGRGKKINMAPVQFSVETMRCPDFDCRTDDFVEGEPIYLHFKSPVKGYLSVYMQEMDTLYCLLPYYSSDGKAFEIVNDKEYTLFSYKHEYNSVESEEYTLRAENNYNELVIHLLFSTNPFTKANDIRIEDRDYLLPRQLFYREFNNWLMEIRRNDENMQHKHLSIRVEQNN